MGQKVHPHGFRVGILYDWESKWFAERDYKQKLHNDIALRDFGLLVGAVALARLAVAYHRRT